MRRWLRERSARWISVAGWVVLVAIAYPGFMSYDSAAQLAQVRSGVYTDRAAPVMTFVWSAAEWVLSGPLPMLIVQCGLALFGITALLRRVLAPRAAAIAAIGVLLLPPVASLFGVIWLHSFATAALLAATGCALQRARRWQVMAAAAGTVALACRPELALAALPLAMLAFDGSRARRVAGALVAVIACAGVARAADALLIDEDTDAWASDLMLPDLVGTLQRAHVQDPATLERALAHLDVIDHATLAARIGRRHDSFDAHAVTTGPHAIFAAPIASFEHAAVRAAWRRAIAEHPAAYLTHRVQLAARWLGVRRAGSPIYDNFGDPAQLTPLHHRASRSDLERAYAAFARALEPLYTPVLWLLVGIVAFALVRERAIRAVLASGFGFAGSLFVLAPSPEYRVAHWIVVTGAIGLAAAIGTRTRWRA